MSNINSVMGEVNSGKTTRRLHFQDELPAGTTESPTETGHTQTHTHTSLTMLSTHIYCTIVLCVETNPVLALHLTINRWSKGQPFKQHQEAAIHLDAHRLRRWVLDISDHQMAYVCINFLNRLIILTDLKARAYAHGDRRVAKLIILLLLCPAGNDLNMACERARVTIDDAPPSPVNHKVRLSCCVPSLH